MTLAEAREAFAAALTDGLTGYTVTARPSGSARPGTGWVIVTSAEPADRLRSVDVTLLAILVLSPNEQQAEEALDELTLPALEALRDLPVFAVAAEPQTYMTGPANAGLYVLTITATLEVQQP